MLTRENVFSKMFARFTCTYLISIILLMIKSYQNLLGLKVLRLENSERKIAKGIKVLRLENSLINFINCRRKKLNLRICLVP